MWLSLVYKFGAEKGSNQQVELKDEGGAVGGGADRQIERSSCYFSSQLWNGMEWNKLSGTGVSTALKIV